MTRVMYWLQQHENQVFLWVNQRQQVKIMDWLMKRMTHLGGASFTISSTLVVALLTHGIWRLLAIQAIISLTLSHLPVALFKKKYPRLRPYLVLPQTKIGKNPLADHSFPSGHTTAIFAIIVPFSISMPHLAAILIPIAFIVAYSRVYLGLHYPSDCIVGVLLGSMSALLASVIL